LPVNLAITICWSASWNTVPSHHTYRSTQKRERERENEEEEGGRRRRRRRRKRKDPKRSP